MTKAPPIAEFQQLAEDHVRNHFSPESVPLILANEDIMGAFASTFRRRVRALERPRRSAIRGDAAPSSGLYLYRLWASDGRLLYIGVSAHLSARLRVHRVRWGDLIERISWEEQPDERTMLAAERRAITDEDPAFNRAGIG